MDQKKFNFIKDKYGLHASWAIWQKEGDTPKSNMGDLSIFDNDKILSQLNPEIVLIGLNFSVGFIHIPFQNFHGKGGGAYKIRYAVKDTPFWGAYMTDIIKDFPEIESGNVMKFLRKNKSLVDENIASFEKELIDIGSVNPTLIAFGAHTYQILKKSLNNKYRILKAIHYSHYISKEKYREHLKEVIKKWNKVKWE